MKARKVQRIIEATLEAERLHAAAVSYDSIEILWDERVVIIRGRRISVPVDMARMSIPVISTDRVIVPREGLVL